MKLDGIHHITAITGDAPRNVEFYVGTMGLRLLKKSVNQDDPTVYHLFYGDEHGHPGADLTFFEYPGSQRGRAGAGMVHLVSWRVASPEAINFWESRLAAEGYESHRHDGRLRFEDPEGLAHELIVYEGDEAPLTAEAPDVPAEYALQGFDGVRAYASDPTRSEALLRDTLAFEPIGEGEWRVAADTRSSVFAYDEAPGAAGIQGAGTVHHVAFTSATGEQEQWIERVRAGGGRPTPVIDRYYFRSVYFREPSGVLFELATPEPGFAVDEPLESLGERIALPPRYEALRERLEERLTPLPDPRRERAAASRS